MVTFTVDRHGKPGMPTFNIRKVRRLLKSGKAEIFCYHPFTVKLLYAESLDTQPVEICEDTGAQHIGISVKSEKHEFAHEQYDLLTFEKERHDDCRHYRRQRRNRLRYRKPRFLNRKKPKGWLAPSLKNARDRHVDIIQRYQKVLPVTSATLEVGSFDTQVLEALEAGRPLPEGTDYRYGPMYGHDTRREAVFYRDGYTCRLCGKSVFTDKGIILRMHHVGFWKGDHSDRMENLVTLCTRCHSPKNHKEHGKLYGWEPKIKPLKGAAFMNTVRWSLYNTVKDLGIDTHLTYGAATKRERLNRNLKKTHANDAYCMGQFHPKHRAPEVKYQKRRRNNRVLEKFYDAVYIDVRDGVKKKAAELPCGRTGRSEPRNSPENMKKFRGRKTRVGNRSIRRYRYTLRPGDTVLYKGIRYQVKGCQHYGEYVILRGLAKAVKVTDVKPVCHCGAWEKV